MKKLTTISLIIFTAILFSSCGKDGKDGKYYVKVNPNAGANSYWDNNSCIPYGMSYYVNYGPCTNTGSFSYEYKIPGWIWTGTYSTSINKGGSAGTFSDGDDGSNRYYVLNLNGNGMSSSVSRTYEETADTKDETSFLDAFNSNSEGDHVDVVVDMGTYTLHIIGNKFPEGSVPTHEPKYVKK